MSILSGSAIRSAVDRGDIVIDPFDAKRVNPASVDLTLGTKIRTYRAAAWTDVLDCKVNNPTDLAEMDHERGTFVLLPGHLYLMHTAERVRTDKYVPVLDGKSSLGRLGVQVHMTAGYGDPGFDGQYTLEVTAVYQTRVYAGMRFCQMRFHTIWRAIDEFVPTLYNGNYTGEASMGPVPSRSWKQFEK